LELTKNIRSFAVRDAQNAAVLSLMASGFPLLPRLFSFFEKPADVPLDRSGIAAVTVEAQPYRKGCRGL
jgi:hypothetical protein